MLKESKLRRNCKVRALALVLCGVLVLCSGGRAAAEQAESFLYDSFENGFGNMYQKSENLKTETSGSPQFPETKTRVLRSSSDFAEIVYKTEEDIVGFETVFYLESWNQKEGLVEVFASSDGADYIALANVNEIIAKTGEGSGVWARSVLSGSCQSRGMRFFKLKIAGTAAAGVDWNPILDYVKIYVGENVSGVDKSALEALVSEAAAKNESSYTGESFQRLSEALANAKAVLANSGATEEDVSNALGSLQSAINGLEAAEPGQQTLYDDFSGGPDSKTFSRSGNLKTESQGEPKFPVEKTRVLRSDANAAEVVYKAEKDITKVEIVSFLESSNQKKGLLALSVSADGETFTPLTNISEEISNVEVGGEPWARAVLEGGGIRRGMRFLKIEIAGTEKAGVDWNPMLDSVKIFLRTEGAVVSDDATLKSITVSVGSLTPEFSPETFEYGVSVGLGVGSIDVSAVANDIGAYIEGDLGTRTLTTGRNVFNIDVTAESGTVKRYVVTVTRSTGTSGGTGGGGSAGGGGGSGSSGGGGSSTKKQTEKTVSKGAAKASELIKQIEDGVNAVFKSSAADITLNKNALNVLKNQSGSALIKAETSSLSTESLTDVQRNQLCSLEKIVGINLLADGEKLDLPFDVCVPYEAGAGRNLAAVRVCGIDGLGNLTSLGCKINEADKTVSFMANGSGIYAVCYDEVFAQENGFYDLFKEDWFYNAISYLSYHNVITGYGNGQVKPEGLCTRAQFVALLQRYAAELGGIAGSRAELSALIERAEDSGENGALREFSDVDESDWFFSSVMWAAENKIVSGYDSGDFKPEGLISREECLQVLYNYAVNFLGCEIPENFDVPGFNDMGETEEWAKSAAISLIKAGIMSGFEQSEKLMPKNNVIRGEAAQMLMNLKRFINPEK